RRRGCRIVKAAHADLRARLNAMFFANRRFEARERRDAIDPERDVDAVLGGEFPRQPPADTGVAVVVDDATEDIPSPAVHRHSLSPGGRAVIIAARTRRRGSAVSTAIITALTPRRS